MTTSKKIDRKIITAILDQYGGNTCFSFNDKIKDCMTYDNTINPGKVLSIYIKYDKDGSPYFEVHLTDKKGKIIQTDCYEILFETDLYKKSSKKNGKDIEYPDEKIAYVGQGARKPRQELEKEICKLGKQNRMLMEQNDRILKNTEQEFLNSQTYIEMQEKIGFLESLVKLDEAALADAEARVRKSTAEIIQIYKDNKKFLAHQEDIDYFTGITENWHYAWEYEKLEQEISRLKGHISTKDILIIQRDEEIKKLHEKIAKLKKSSADKNSTSSVCININKMEERIQKNVTSGKKKRGRKSALTDEMLHAILELHRKGYTIRDIAEQTGTSVGWTHEIIKRNTEQN